MESLVIVDRLCRPIVYFSMYFSRNSGITRYSGHFAADGRIHYYERRLYLHQFESLCLLCNYLDSNLHVFRTLAYGQESLKSSRWIAHTKSYIMVGLGPMCSHSISDALSYISLNQFSTTY